MKQSIYASVLCCQLLFAASVGAQVVNTANVSKRPANSMAGAYQLTRQAVDFGKGDSVIQINQLKIFTDRYMMYAHALPNDSLATYGVATYTVDGNGAVTENVFYTAEGGMAENSFALIIKKKPGGYRQLLTLSMSDGSKALLTEDYNTVSKRMTTPMDGAWKQVKQMYYPKEGEPVAGQQTQFKMYQSGHFMWANTVKDSATGKPVSVYGYGNFTMRGSDVVETNTSSTFKTLLVNRPVVVQVRFADKDHFEQSITLDNGDRAVEWYERMQ